LKIPNHTILAIESSCDDTGVAVVRGNQVLSNLVANQKVHSRYGGVVPELASRAHQSNMVPTITLALVDAGVSMEEIDAVAYTNGPGLSGSLHVGSSFAKSWAWANDIPTIPVHHMRAHILAHFLDKTPSPEFPFLCLTVSGGHTQIVQVDSSSEMQVIGTTVDDAAGEAFDKVAKLIGLPYPGGPLIDKYSKLGNHNTLVFKHSRVGGLNLSFSGFKTQILRFLQIKLENNPDFFSPENEQNLYDFCASVQHTIVSMLMEKLESAVEQTGINEIAIAGGVSANSGLRNSLELMASSKGWNTYIPPLKYCTDNAAMVGMVGVFDFEEKRFGTLSDVPSPRLPDLRNSVE
jgi:N6-L-threonylcarbamoyladenine synthase